MVLRTDGPVWLDWWMCAVVSHDRGKYLFSISLIAARSVNRYNNSGYFLSNHPCLPMALCFVYLSRARGVGLCFSLAYTGIFSLIQLSCCCGCKRRTKLCRGTRRFTCHPTRTNDRRIYEQHDARRQGQYKSLLSPRSAVIAFARSCGKQLVCIFLKQTSML